MCGRIGVAERAAREQEEVSRSTNPRHITVKEQVCSPDIELLAVGVRPYYLPREFSHAIILCVYIPPTADATRAADVIISVTAGLQTQHPDAFIAISGDFNHVVMDSNLPKFKQFVDCRTRENKTLDRLYANVKDAYSTIALPPPGQIRSQPSLPQAQVHPCSPEAASDHKNCTEVATGGYGDPAGLL